MKESLNIQNPASRQILDVTLEEVSGNANLEFALDSDSTINASFFKTQNSGSTLVIGDNQIIVSEDPLSFTKGEFQNVSIDGKTVQIKAGYWANKLFVVSSVNPNSERVAA